MNEFENEVRYKFVQYDLTVWQRIVLIASVTACACKHCFAVVMNRDSTEEKCFDTFKQDVVKRILSAHLMAKLARED